MAEHSVLQRNYEAAIQWYKVGSLECKSTTFISSHTCIVQEALQFHADDDVALCALARLYLMTDDLDQCQYSCMTLLR